MTHDICGPRDLHMTTLDTQTWLREKVHGLGLTDKDISLLRRRIAIS
jgi:hypothetical protein